MNYITNLACRPTPNQTIGNFRCDPNWSMS